MNNSAIEMLAKKLGIGVKEVNQIMNNQVTANVQAKTAHNLERD